MLAPEGDRYYFCIAKNSNSLFRAVPLALLGNCVFALNAFSLRIEVNNPFYLRHNQTEPEGAVAKVGAVAAANRHTAALRRVVPATTTTHAARA